MRLPWLKKKPLLPEEENRIIVKAIRHAEQCTSGEVRVYIERHCRFMDSMDRAAEIFFSLQMEKTEQRNAVLVYIALKDRQLAVFADEGIHKKVGMVYWNKLVNEMIISFNRDNYGEGIGNCVVQIGEALQTYFPFDKATDKNELPDSIVFGK
jgi:uncharacterized membrane protein